MWSGGREDGGMRWWVPGVGVILVGCFFLVAGVAARVANPVGVVELVDGVVIAAVCFATGSVMLSRHNPRH